MQLSISLASLLAERSVVFRDWGSSGIVCKQKLRDWEILQSKGDFYLILR